MAETNNGARRVLASGRLQLQRHRQQTWFVDKGVEEGVTLDDLLDHDFWIHKPFGIRPFDEIIVYPKDGAWRAELHVIDADETGLLLDKISFVEFKRVAEMREAAGIPYRIQPAGPGKGFEIDRADGVKIGPFPSRQAAEEHLRNFAPSIARSA